MASLPTSEGGDTRAPHHVLNKGSLEGELVLLPLYVPWIAFLLGLLPFLALWTYPGWPEVAVGYTPYFNFHRWIATPTLVWTPPYTVNPLIPVHVSLPYTVTAVYTALGGSPLAGLRFTAALATCVTALGLMLGLRQKWGDWPALTAVLAWVYSPATVVLAFHLGHLGELWLWAGAAWAYAAHRMWASTQQRGRPNSTGMALSLLGLLITWGVLLWPGWEVWLTFPWRRYTLLWGGAALLATPVVAWGVKCARRWGTPWLLAFIVAAVAARLTLVAAPPTYTSYSPPPQPVAIFGENALVLLDAQLKGTLAPGHTVTVTTAWQALRPQPTNWTTFTQVLGPDSRIWGQHDKPTGGDYPTSRWRVGEVVIDTYRLVIAPEAPTGLRLIMGIYDPTTLKRAPTHTGSDYVELWP